MSSLTESIMRQKKRAPILPGTGSAPAPAGGDAEKVETLQRQKSIGSALKAMFDDVAREPLPDEFLDLLSKLESSQERSK